MSHEQAPTSYYHNWGHVPYTEAVAKATNGRVTIEIYPSQTLLKSAAAFEGVKSKIADLAWMFTGYFPGQFEVVETLTLPFMVPNGEIGSRIAWNLFAEFPEIQKQFEGVKMLCIWTSEPHYYVSGKKNFKSIDDFNGIKVRASGGPPTELMKNLGASPMLFGMPDVYMNLQKGVVDAAQCSSESYYGNKLYEVAKYVTFVPAAATVHFLVMNWDVWNSFPKDIQDAIMSVSGETGSVGYGKGVYDRARQEMPGDIKKAGYEPVYYTVPPDELSKWTDVAAKPIWNDWMSKLKAKGFTSSQQVFDRIPVLVKQFSPK
jgi:TRAP-type C4-dicarboxylate transport system substrate-binding protein